MEVRDFRDRRARFEKAGAAIVGISPDPPKRNAKFAEKQELDFPLLSDESKETLNAWGVWKTKKLYGREYLGVERSTFVVDEEGTLQLVYRKVKVPGHVEAVLSDVERLAAEAGG